MRKKALSILVLLAIFISLKGYAQDKKTVKAKLNEATVFFQGAELMHSASYTLVKGENEIYIEGLSPNIDKNSLKIKTTNNVIVSAYEFSVDYLSEGKSLNVKTKKLNDSIEYYGKKLDEINTDIKITKNLIDLLQKAQIKMLPDRRKDLA